MHLTMHVRKLIYYQWTMYNLRHTWCTFIKECKTTYFYQCSYVRQLLKSILPSASQFLSLGEQDETHKNFLKNEITVKNFKDSKMTLTAVLKQYSEGEKIMR